MSERKLKVKLSDSDLLRLTADNVAFHENDLPKEERLKYLELNNCIQCAWSNRAEEMKRHHNIK